MGCVGTAHFWEFAIGLLLHDFNKMGMGTCQHHAIEASTARVAKSRNARISGVP